MPTQIHNPRLGARERYFARQATYRLAQQTKLVETAAAPWLGWVPDLPPHLCGWRGYYDGRGFMPYAFAERGLVLRDDDGYERIDPDHMVGGGAAAPALPAADAGGGVWPLHGHPGWQARAVTMLHQYRDSTNPPVLQRVVIVAGTEAGGANYTADILMARIDGTGAWSAIYPSDDIPQLQIPEGNRDALWDAAVFPFGCPDATRVNQNNAAAPVNGPVLVMCNSDASGPVDNVLITPCNGVGHNAYDVELYDELAPSSGVGPPYPHSFHATSCESFNGRMHFLDTFETDAAGAARHRQRHRWTAIGTAYPNEAIIGSGYLDLVEFDGRGLRIESLGNKLALYFEDGVAFQVPTNLYSDAYRPQIISRSRSLLGTHSLCSIDPNRHFGIFDDGWYFLDSSGRWSEAGTLVLEETKGKSHELHKWKETFYDELDRNNRHRTVCRYDKFRKVVRIAFNSTKTAGDNVSILNYHWPTDTCWRDQYFNGVTMWGHYDYQIEAGTIWGTPGGMGGTLTWGAVTGTWSDYAPRYIDGTIVHGNSVGLVFNRNPGLDTYDGRPIACSYLTHLQSRTSDPIKGQTFHRLGVEYVMLSASGGSVAVLNGAGGAQSTSLPLVEGEEGSLQTAYANFRLHGSHHALWMLAFAPIAIRSITPELLIYSLDDRSGQV